MGRKNASSKIAAIILIATNLLLMVLSIAVFAIGVWMVSSASTMSSIIQNYGNPTIKTLFPREVLSVQLGVALAILASFFFFVSFMGFYGAIDRTAFLLFMYAMLVLLLLLLECALLFYFFTNFIEKGLQENDGQWTHALRLIFSCCEHNSTTFMSISDTLKLPWSCCGTRGFPNNCSLPLIQNKSCQQTISEWIYKYQTAIYASLAVAHIMLASCSIMRRTGHMPSLSHS